MKQGPQGGNRGSNLRNPLSDRPFDKKVISGRKNSTGPPAYSKQNYIYKR